MTLVVFVILCKICVRFLLLASSGGFLLPGAQRGFFTAERGGRRQFQLAVPCQPGRFRPHASYLRKEARCRASAKKLPKGTPWKGFLWTLPETEGPRSLWHPGAARYRDFPSRALLRTFERSLVGGTTNLEDPTWRKANFLWKFLCAGGCYLPTAAGTPSPPQSPRKDFCRAKMPCGGERLPNLLLGSLIVERIAYRIAAAIQNESAGKNRRRALIGSGTA